MPFRIQAKGLTSTPFSQFLRNVLAIELKKPLLQLTVLAIASLLYCATLKATDFIAFESGPVRPMALSQDRDLLFAVNTPDNRLEIFKISETGTLTHCRGPSQ